MPEPQPFTVGHSIKPALLQMGYQADQFTLNLLAGVQMVRACIVGSQKFFEPLVPISWDGWGIVDLIFSHPLVWSSCKIWWFIVILHICVCVCECVCMNVSKIWGTGTWTRVLT